MENKEIGEMTEEELHERYNALFNRRTELMKEIKAIDAECFQIANEILSEIVVKESLGEVL